MAKKKETTLKGWDEVDSVLRRMGEIDIALAKVEGDMTLRINQIKAEADAKAEGLKAERKTLEEDITLFAEERKGEFAKNRTRELTFGVVAFRVTRKIVIKSKAACLAAMHALGLESYVRRIEEPDKEAMEGLDDATLAKVGASRKVADNIRIEPSMEKIKEAV